MMQRQCCCTRAGMGGWLSSVLLLVLGAIASLGCARASTDWRLQQIAADGASSSTETADAAPQSRPLADEADDSPQVMTPRNRDDLLAIQRQVEQVAATRIACTVGIEVGAARGSGVIISPDGYVLTAGHVSREPGLDCAIVLADGRRVRGKTLGMDVGIDSGLIKISQEGDWPYAPLGKSQGLHRGQWCVAIGHPGGFRRDRPPVVRLGRVIFSNSKVIRTDNTLVSGDSGGPLFDLDGKVIGIHSRIGQSTTANIHVPVDAYAGEWDRLVAGEAWGYAPGQPGGPFVGISGEDAPHGARVLSLVPGHAAEKAGLEVGDVITRFDGRPVRGYGDLVSMINRRKPDDEITLKVERGEQTLEIKIKLGRRPDRAP